MKRHLLVLFLVSLAVALRACGSADLATHKIPAGEPGAKAYVIKFDGL